MTGLTGLVLCGGAGRRMGSDKALMEVRGRRLVELVAERMAELADPVLLAAGTPGRLGELGYPQLLDEPPGPGAGPLPGLAAGLAASPHPLLAAVAVDMPFASPAVFRLLVERWHDEDAVVPVTPDGLQPLHAVYARKALPMVRDALGRGTLALVGLLSRLRVAEVPEREWRAADPAGRFALNLNRPADLELLRQEGTDPRL